MLFHHHKHLKANQTRRQAPLQNNVFCSARSRRASSSLWVSSTPRRQVSNLSRPTSTHALTQISILTTPSTPESSRHFHQKLSWSQHPRSQSHQGHTALAVCKPSTTAPCMSVRTRLGQVNNTTASPLGTQVLPSRFSTPSTPPPRSPGRNVRQLLHRQRRARTGPWTLQYRRLDVVKKIVVPIWCVGYVLTVACNG